MYKVPTAGGKLSIKELGEYGREINHLIFLESVTK
jgi:hypothetical protein